MPPVSAWYGTTHHALVDRAKIRSGETLLVTGAGGGVGIAAVQLGVARVIAAAGSAEKRAAATAAGACRPVAPLLANRRHQRDVLFR